MSNRNYVGITGFTRLDEILSAAKVYSSVGITIDNPSLVPMMGFLISPRNLDPEWHSIRYPRLIDFSSLLSNAVDHAFTTLHIDSKRAIEWNEDLVNLVEKVNYPRMNSWASVQAE